MKTKTFPLIACLLDAMPSYMTATEIAECLGVSSRTVLRYAAQWQKEQQAYGFTITSRKGKGFRLTVVDSELFDHFWGKQSERMHMPSASQLIEDIARQMLLSESLRLNELAELFHYSRSSISRALSMAISLLNSYGIQTQGKPYQGLLISGREINIRNALYHLVCSNTPTEKLYEALDISAAIWHAFQEELRTFEALKAQTRGQKSLEQFLRYAAISISRLQKGCPASFSGTLDPSIFIDPSTQSMISSLFSNYFPSSATPLEQEQEILYLSIVWEQTLSSHDLAKNTISALMESGLLVLQEAFAQIKINFNADFSQDLLLKDSLLSHMMNSCGKYLIGMESENMYCEEVRSRYPVAYYYSIELAKAIRKYCLMPLADNEIGLITLHFASSLERAAQVKKIHVAILCKSEFGTTSLLRARLNRQYQNIEFVGVYSPEEILSLHLPVEIYLSTVPLPEVQLGGKPILIVSPLLDEADRQKIDRAIDGLLKPMSIHSVLQENHFFLLKRKIKKEAVLNTICNSLIKMGDLTAADKEAIYERETLASTVIAPGVVMPHCIIQDESFLSITLLDHPILWGRHPARMIILGCFHQGDGQIKQMLAQLFHVIQNEHNVEVLCACRNYQEFVTSMDSFF